MANDLRQIQLIDVEILKQLIKIFEDNKLTYYMIAGSLLGAVRHNGFIPWDDDMDIGMPREDYEKFLNRYYSELPDHLEVLNFKTDKKFNYCITRIADKRYTVKEIRNRETDNVTYASIDIFPIDGAPDNFILRWIYYFRILTNRALISLIQKKNIDKARKRNFMEKIVIFIGTRLPIGKVFNDKKLLLNIDKLLQKQSNSSKFAGSIMGAYRIKEMYLREYLGKGTVLTFEKMKVNCPENYDEYLKHMYGNYKQLPSKTEREAKRHFKIES